MRSRHKLWGLFSAAVAIIVIIILSGGSRPSATTRAVGMTFVGYTNFPGNHLRFALFAVSNRSAFAVRWRGDRVEVEGGRYDKGRTVDTRMPGYTYGPVLENGKSLTLAVGEPFDGSETGRWRFAMSYSRYSVRERWLDLQFRHKLPLRLGSLVRVDDQSILAASNHLTTSSTWLTK